MKIKRLTFTKFTVKIVFTLIPLLIMYHWVPKETRVDFPFVYMILTLIAYEFGKFVAKEITTD
jgi:hypothetical protein